jgi:hypothetical protein
MDKNTNLIEDIAMTIYCDSYTQYGTCTPLRWKQTSEDQRQFCRGQAAAVIRLLEERNLFKNTTAVFQSSP